MIPYTKQNLNECLDLIATEKNISRQELEKDVYIYDFGVVRSPSLFFNFFKAEKEFAEMAKKYDSVINDKNKIIFERKTNFGKTRIYVEYNFKENSINKIYSKFKGEEKIIYNGK